MATWLTTCWSLVPILVGVLRHADCCGTVTHIEISYRAQDSFHSFHSNIDYETLLHKHQDALEGGSPYPDSFYDPVCFGGRYHSISEDTHWTPFMNATVNYIRKHYPPPWDEGTEKLVVFLLGVVSHQTADVSWHGLGIAQGFLDAMGALNYHGSFSDAHPVGDVGGDIMTMFEFDVSHMSYLEEWYIPVDDLYNIYTELYGASRMPKSVIIACTLEMYAERFGEKLAIGKLYADYAGKSPFLVDQLTDYFLGGLDDMAVWTQNVWRETILMLDKGTEACTLDHNPLFIQCKGRKKTRLQKSGGKRERNGYFRKRRFTNVGKKDIVVQEKLRGVVMSPGLHIKEALYNQKKRREEAMMLKKSQQRPSSYGYGKTHDAVYSVNNTYAKLGLSMAVGDLDGDGNEDVVIGAPGYRQGTSPQDGAVFVVFGSDKGLPLVYDTNLETSADVILYGMEYVNGRLGFSVAVVDINLDGIPDIAAGAPSSGSSQLGYTGSVEVFYGVGRRAFVHNMTVSCQYQYCSLGRSLAVGDVDGDGDGDLLIGTPYSGAKGDQRGLVTAVVANKKYQGYFAMVSVSQLPWMIHGSQNYSWLGETVAASVSPTQKGDTFLLLSEPAWRACALPNCSFSANDTQSVGMLNVFLTGPGKPASLAFQKKGTGSYQRYGSSAAIGKPLADGTVVLAVSAPGQDVEGSVAGIHMSFPQTGAVMLYNLSNPLQPPLAVFSGDRRYSRFGNQVKFSDINGDGFDDLLVGASFRTEDITEEIYAGEEGAAYIFFGGSSFPTGSQATSQCPTLTPVKPCPADVASVVLMFGEDKARFGSQIAVVKSKTKTDVLMTALHSSRAARLGGAVAVYSFSKT